MRDPPPGRGLMKIVANFVFVAEFFSKRSAAEDDDNEEVRPSHPLVPMISSTSPSPSSSSSEEEEERTRLERKSDKFEGCIVGWLKFVFVFSDGTGKTDAFPNSGSLSLHFPPSDKRKGSVSFHDGDTPSHLLELDPVSNRRGTSKVTLISLIDEAIVFLPQKLDHITPKKSLTFRIFLASVSSQSAQLNRTSSFALVQNTVLYSRSYYGLYNSQLTTLTALWNIQT